MGSIGLRKRRFKKFIILVLCLIFWVSGTFNMNMFAGEESISQIFSEEAASEDAASEEDAADPESKDLSDEDSGCYMFRT